jgi:hypothetical protein
VGNTISQIEGTCRGQVETSWLRNALYCIQLQGLGCDGDVCAGKGVRWGQATALLSCADAWVQLLLKHVIVIQKR